MDFVRDLLSESDSSIVGLKVGEGLESEIEPETDRSSVGDFVTVTVSSTVPVFVIVFDKENSVTESVSV